MPCSGCGGKGHTPGETYGHILGCGATKFMEDDRFNPMVKEVQREILFDAVNLAMKNGRPGTKEFADELGEALGALLGSRGVDKVPYPQPKASRKTGT